MTLQELVSSVRKEYDSRNLKSTARYSALNKVANYIVGCHGGNLSVFNKDKDDFKDAYKKYKGKELNSAESSAINELYNQYYSKKGNSSDKEKVSTFSLGKTFSRLCAIGGKIVQVVSRKENNGKSSKSVAGNLMNESKFKSVSDLSASEIPDAPGLYAIRIKDVHKLPSVFSKELNKRGHNLLYIGIASESLLERLWKQELNHQKPATFFRSIGAMLGFRPVKGSLFGKNTRNYKFDTESTEKIRCWMKENLLVNYYVISDNLENVEKQLIYDYKPIVNIENNPNKMSIISDLRHQCVEIAKCLVLK